MLLLLAEQTPMAYPKYTCLRQRNGGVLKQVLGIDDRYDWYIENTIPERSFRHRIDGGREIWSDRSKVTLDTMKVTDGGWVRRLTSPTTDAAKQWSGWGTALKPAHEPVIVACKPFEDGSLPTAHLNWPPCFYAPKASKSERNAGLDAFPETVADPYGQRRGRRMADNDTRFDGKPPSRGRNTHPTVKPVSVMSWILGLEGAVPKGGLVCDPFLGSGSTGVAAVQAGIDFLGIEMESEYADIARARISYADPTHFRDGILGMLTGE